MKMKPTLYAVRLPAALTPEVQSGYVFVGVRCKHCEIAYAVALPNTVNNGEAILAAIEWVLANIGPCGAHPTVLCDE